MANMSYCRFENTYEDLRDCAKALKEANGISGVVNGIEGRVEKANQYEAPWVSAVVELCKEIADRWGHELED